MARANFALASQGLNTGGNPGRLTPVPLNDGIAGGLRVPNINVHAADVRFTPYDIPEIVIDESLSAASRFANTWADMAFRVQEHESNLRADAVVLRAGEKFNELYSKYTQLEGEAAVTEYGTMASKTNALMEKSLDGLEDSVKSKAVLRLQSLKNQTLNSAAGYKVRQLKIWNRNTEQNKREALINDVSRVANDPAEFQSRLFGALEENARRLAAQPELMESNARGIIDSVYDKTLTTQIALENWGLVNAYLDLGEKSGANAQMLAIRGKQASTALIASQRRREDQNERERKLEDQQQWTTAVGLVYAAIKYGNPSTLAQLPLEIRKRAEDLYDSILTGTKSPPSALQGMQNAYDQVLARPEAIFDEGRFPEVSGADKIKFFDQVIKDRATGAGQARKEVKSFLDRIIPEPKGGGTIAQKDAAGYRALRSELTSRFNAAIQEAIEKRTNIDYAVSKAKIELLNDPNWRDDYSKLKLHQAQFDIRGIPNGGIRGYEEYAKDDDFPADERMSRIDEEYGASSEALLLRYGVLAPKDGKLQFSALMDSSTRRQFMQDVVRLNMQRRYLLNLIQGLGSAKSRRRPAGEK